MRKTSPAPASLPPDGPLAVGQPAPDFAVTTDAGDTVRLGDHAGRPLVVVFYPKADTSGCTRSLQEISALLPRFAAAGASLLGVSPDTQTAQAKWKAKSGIAVPLGADVERTMLEAYGVWAQQSMYGKPYMGVERTTVLIDRNGRVARVWPKVKVPGHADEVLAAVEELSRAQPA